MRWAPPCPVSQWCCGDRVPTHLVRLSLRIHLSQSSQSAETAILFLSAYRVQLDPFVEEVKGAWQDCETFNTCEEAEAWVDQVLIPDPVHRVHGLKGVQTLLLSPCRHGMT